MKLAALSQNAIKNKRVLLRLDLNLPIGVAIDNTRLLLHLETIDVLKKNHNQIIVLSHFGRPKSLDPYFSLEFLAEKIAQFTKSNVRFIESTDFDAIQDIVIKSDKSTILLLENTRFFDGETTNDVRLAQSFANLADVFVNDAFSVCHRAHASVVGIPQYLPSFAGLQIEKELKALEHFLSNPVRPSIAIVGGSKISSKFNLLENLAHKFDHLFIGGAMAHSLLLSEGIDIGASFYEPDFLEEAQALLCKYRDKIILPTDFVVMDSNAQKATRDITTLEHDDKILDIGTATKIRLKTFIHAARTLVWNGPLGFYEDPRFAEGTAEIAHFVAELTTQGAIMSVIGGGDIVSAIKNIGDMNVNDFSYISTSGGAFLAWLEDKELPGLRALMR
jgi:phosphoglycerate kinase